MARMGVEHFKRAMAAFKAIAAALALPDLNQRQAALGLVPEYRSRGKGRGSVSRNWMRPYPNRKVAFQGKQECARRRRQIKLGILNRENGLWTPAMVAAGMVRA